MLSFYNKYAGNAVYSQNGEELILQECLKRIGIEKGVCFEAGGHNGKYLSNTAYLIDQGWTGKFVEADFDLHVQACENWKHAKDRVKCMCSEIGPENINAFIPADIDVVSIDIDGNDLACFKAMTAKPAIVIIEINSGFPPDVEHDTHKEGCSYLTAAKAAIEKGYFVLCHTGNLILLDKKHRKLFPEIKGDGIKNAGEYFRDCWLKQMA